MSIDRLGARAGSRPPRGARVSGSPDTISGGRPSSVGRWRFWGAAYTLLILLTGTNLPTPLYRGYEARFGFSPLVVTLIFAAYVAVLIPVCCSPARSRTRSAIAGAAAGGGRGRTGIAGLRPRRRYGVAVRRPYAPGPRHRSGLGSLTAALTELEPSGNRRKAALVSTVASVGGLGLGPVLAGLLAQYAPAPYVLPYAIEIALLIPAAAAVLALPATRSGKRWRPRRPGIPHAMRAVFATSGTAGFLAFAVIGLFLTLVPTYVATLSGSGNLLLGGAAVALMLACSALAQLIGYGRPARALELAGLPLLAAGLVLLALAGGVASLPLLLAATVIAGIGQGLVFLGGLTAVNQAAPAERRADVISSFYVIMYLGVGLPVIGVGLLAAAVGLLAAVQYFACVVAALCLMVLLALAIALVRAPARR